ncbi:hypothetical protein AB0L42_17575 [Streptomyces sp. NPDC052287]|uniref:hypothetical protein n=1 Tax=Streptomyces sp. NPDC052287 TaxID=3154950 RepID=UPI003432CC35
MRDTAFPGDAVDLGAAPVPTGYQGTSPFSSWKVPVGPSASRVAGRTTTWSADHVPFDSVMGNGHRERTLSMLDSPYLVEKWSLPTAVVLLSGDGHYWIGLDYRASGRHGEPSVTWFDRDRSCPP